MSENSNEVDRTQEEIDSELQSAERWARSNPNNLPSQFGGDPDKFLASYKEMRATLTRTQQENAKLKATNEKPQAEESASEKPPETLSVPAKSPEPEPSQEDWSSWGSEIVETGNLAEDTRSKIRSRFKIPDSIIDEYIDGAKARQRQAAEEAANVVGGASSLKKIIEWAANNLNEQERVAVNGALRQPGWQNVVLGLKARMDASNPEPKTKVATTAGVPSALKPFANVNEMTKAMRDPRYKFDADYQNMVQARVRLTGVTKNA